MRDQLPQLREDPLHHLQCAATICSSRAILLPPWLGFLPVRLRRTGARLLESNEAPQQRPELCVRLPQQQRVASLRHHAPAVLHARQVRRLPRATAACVGRVRRQAGTDGDAGQACQAPCTARRLPFFPLPSAPASAQVPSAGACPITGQCAACAPETVRPRPGEVRRPRPGQAARAAALRRRRPSRAAGPEATPT